MKWLAFSIGFYGYLFPGNINLMVLDLYKSGRFYFLILIGILILLFESLYCYYTLFYLDALMINPELFRVIEIFAYTFTLGMGMWMITEKANPIKNSQNSVLRGVISIIIHPQQIPFWLWMGILFGETIYLHPGEGPIAAFILFNALGTSLVIFLYSFLGNKILTFFNLRLYYLNKAAGFLYVIIAIISFIKTFYR
jgi:hypothetical protein